jgi:hypothetical protein
MVLVSMEETMKLTLPATARLCAAVLAICGPLAHASSHREALAVLNEPCADNTDTYAWVSPGDHSKLYLIANFNPLHEPGQGNQGLRACNGYRYEFHIGKGTSLADQMVYRIEFKNSEPGDGVPGAHDPVGGGNELLWQLTGASELYSVKRIDGQGRFSLIGDSLKVAPNNHGPQTDRLLFGLGEFKGYESGDNVSRKVGLYNDAFIAQNYIHTLTNGGRVFSGQRDDPYYLDEKGIFDLVNLCRDGLFGIPGARDTPCEDVFTGFNVFTVALEIPITDLFPDGIPHNGELRPDSTDSLLRVWFNISRREKQIVDEDNVVTGYRYKGDWKQVGRNALPLFNAGLVGTSRQTKYLRSSPMQDVSNFGADILFPVLVRDAEVLGIYAALGINPRTAGLIGPRLDIINAINLGRPIPIADGSTGDVITLDAAIDSQFPNGRRLDGGSAPNREHVDVSDALISLIVAGNPAAGAGDGVNGNDKNYLSEFPFVPLPHDGLNGGHGGTNIVP